MTPLYILRSEYLSARETAAGLVQRTGSRALHHCAAPLAALLTARKFSQLLIFAGYVLLLTLDAAFAGPFGGSDQTLGNGLRAFMQYYRALTVLAGVGALFTAGIMKWFGRPFAGPMIASALCFAATAIGEVLYSFGRNGQSVPFSAGQNYDE